MKNSIPSISELQVRKSVGKPSERVRGPNEGSEMLRVGSCVLLGCRLLFGTAYFDRYREVQSELRTPQGRCNTDSNIERDEKSASARKKCSRDFQTKQNYFL